MSVPAFTSERQFTRWVLKEARERGWLAGHLSNMQIVSRPPETPGGKRIPVAVPDRDADGFPDVVLVHETHGLIFAELKYGRGKPDEAQLHWLRMLRGAGVSVYVFWPRDVGPILELLETGDLPQLSFDLLAREQAS